MILNNLLNDSGFKQDLNFLVGNMHSIRGYKFYSNAIKRGEN
ncbi:MAG: hypothetical protein ACI9EK_001663 [Psychroserpens sp.]|jgi:hypothetical protein